MKIDKGERMMAIQNRLFAVVALLGSMLLVGCASGPSVRSDYDRSATFSSYETFGFASELGTDRAGYSSLLTNHFKSAVRSEMEALGYEYTDKNPDLIVNFFTRVTERSEVRVRPSMTVGTGYHGYRYGLYTAWPMYEQEVDTMHYRMGTATIDLVDAEREQLIWEGVAEGRLTQKALENLKPAVENTVREVFTRFPPEPEQ